jgi:hypothetical protein
VGTSPRPPPYTPQRTTTLKCTEISSPATLAVL